MIIYQKKIVKFYLATDEGQIESTESFQDFCDFLEDEVGLPNIDIDDMNNVNDSIEIFAIKNKDDIDNDSTQIESHEDFGDVFENFNPHSDPRQVFYFFVKVGLSLSSISVIFSFCLLLSIFLFFCLF